MREDEVGHNDVQQTKHHHRGPAEVSTTKHRIQADRKEHRCPRVTAVVEHFTDRRAAARTPCLLSVGTVERVRQEVENSTDEPHDAGNRGMPRVLFG